MSLARRVVATLIVSSLGAGAVMAQDSAYHSTLSDRFVVSLGAFRSDSALELSASGNREKIDFDEAAKVDDSATIFNGQFRWRVGETRRWSVSGQYFSIDGEGSAILNEDVEWQGITFPEGTAVGAGVDVEIVRVFVGRNFVHDEQKEFGIGAGLHKLQVSSFVEGAVPVDDDSLEFRRGDAKLSQLLPNFGGWGMYSPAKRWLLHGRVDWISAKIGDYDGTLWNLNAGVNYEMFRHVGIDLSYQYLNLDFNVDKSDWQGSANLGYRGPVVSITGSW